MNPSASAAQTGELAWRRSTHPHTLWSCLTLLLAPKNEGTKEKGQIVAGGEEICMCKIVKVKRQRH